MGAALVSLMLRPLVVLRRPQDLKYKCDVYLPAASRKYNGHATTAHNRILRPQSSLRFGYRL